MYIVKLTFNYDWPVFRQTPGNDGIWGNYKFVIDENLKECDFWVIYSDYLLKDETVICSPENVIFLPAECYSTSPRFSQEFLDQFGAILTVQRELQHRNITYVHNANPWFVNKTYQELAGISRPEKQKLISVISSNKAFTEGHKKRLDFVNKLKDKFEGQIDVFGRGILDFDDKWDVLADYKYSIAIENDYCDDWMTEKLIDCYLAYTYPIYYGCPNLEQFMPSDSFARIDINNIEESIAIIEKVISANTYDSKQDTITKARIQVLNQENLFPLLAGFLDKMNPHSPKQEFHFIVNSAQPINPPAESSFKETLKKVINYIYDRLSKKNLI